MNELYNSWMIVFLLVAGHGFFLASFLWFKSKAHATISYLCALILLFSLSLLYYVAFWTGITETVSPFWALILTAPTVYGPLIYRYVCRLDNRTTSAWHFLPFFFHILFMTGYYLDQTKGWQLPVFNRSIAMTFTVLQNISLTVYAALLFSQINEINKQLQARIRLMAWFFSGFVVSFVSYYILIFTIDFQPIYDYAISISMSCFMYLVGYLATNVNWISTGRASHPMYQKSGLTDNLADHYRQELLRVMKTEKPYMDGNLKLPQLAARLNITPHNLSELINRQFGVNFAEFLNRYRVTEACRLIDDSPLKQSRLIDIAYQVGFNNKTSFTQTFKKHTGITPSQFRAGSSPNLNEDSVRK